MRSLGSCSRAPGSQIRNYLPGKGAADFEKIKNDYINTLVGVLKNTRGGTTATQLTLAPSIRVKLSVLLVQNRGPEGQQPTVVAL
jgi:hypothetical protein